METGSWLKKCSVFPVVSLSRSTEVLCSDLMDKQEKDVQTAIATHNKRIERN